MVAGLLQVSYRVPAECTELKLGYIEFVMAGNYSTLGIQLTENGFLWTCLQKQSRCNDAGKKKGGGASQDAIR